MLTRAKSRSLSISSSRTSTPGSSGLPPHPPFIANVSSDEEEKSGSRATPNSISPFDFGLPSPPFKLGSPLLLSPKEETPTFEESNPWDRPPVPLPLPSFDEAFRPLKQETFFINRRFGSWTPNQQGILDLSSHKEASGFQNFLKNKALTWAFSPQGAFSVGPRSAQQNFPFSCFGSSVDPRSAQSRAPSNLESALNFRSPETNCFAGSDKHRVERFCPRFL